MRKSKAVGIVTVLLLSLAVVAASPSPSSPEPAASEDGVSVYFSPKGGCEDAVVAQMRTSKRSIDVQAYSFTNTAIAKALVDAKKRGAVFGRLGPPLRAQDATHATRSSTAGHSTITASAVDARRRSSPGSAATLGSL